MEAKRLFKKVLVANRGEIAVRVMRACREMGIATVAVYSDADRRAPHVTCADEAYPVGPTPSTESYLRIDRILEVARRSGAEAIHPGYGFLAENEEFRAACDAAGIVFVGPQAAAMKLMGSKTAARQAVIAAGLPTVPGMNHTPATFDELMRAAQTIGLPVMIKAAAGGGGKGMRFVRSLDELESAYRNARSEAQNSFNDPSIYLEKYLERPRHIEIQILGDHHGNLIHLGERECSLQRRHQKLLEESPSPLVDEPLRRRMGETAVAIGRLAGYTNAGTVEFLVDGERNFYFLEMNTRLQVEHPVTELVTGIDLVKEQFRIAAGEPLAWRQADVGLRGAAIECRISAEDPAQNFFPSPGLITGLRTPSGPGVRNDSGVSEGFTVPLEYDPLLSKLIVWARDRSEAIARMARALNEYEVTGIKTNIAFFQRLLRRPEFVAAELDTSLIARLLQDGLMSDDAALPGEECVAMVAAAIHSVRAAPSLSQRTPDPNGSSALAGRTSAWKLAGREALLERWPKKR